MNAILHLQPPLLVFLLGLLLLYMPNLTRPELYFSVTVPAGFRQTPGAHRALRCYRIEMCAHVAIALLLAAGLAAVTAWGFDIALVWLLVGGFRAFFSARRLVPPHAAATASVREAERGAPQSDLNPLLLWFTAGPFVILSAAALFAARHRAELPARFPIHWDLRGVANAWATPETFPIATCFVAGCLTAAFVLGICFAAVRGARRTEVSPGF